MPNPLGVSRRFLCLITSAKDGSDDNGTFMYTSLQSIILCNSVSPRTTDPSSQAT